MQLYTAISAKTIKITKMTKKQPKQAVFSGIYNLSSPYCERGKFNKLGNEEKRKETCIQAVCGRATKPAAARLYSCQGQLEPEKMENVCARKLVIPRRKNRAQDVGLESNPCLATLNKTWDSAGSCSENQKKSPQNGGCCTWPITRKKKVTLSWLPSFFVFCQKMGLGVTNLLLNFVSGQPQDSLGAIGWVSVTLFL